MISLIQVKKKEELLEKIKEKINKIREKEKSVRNKIFEINNIKIVECIIKKGRDNTNIGITQEGIVVLFSEPPKDDFIDKRVYLVDFELRTSRNDRKYFKCFSYSFTLPENIKEMIDKKDDLEKKVDEYYKMYLYLYDEEQRLKYEVRDLKLRYFIQKHNIDTEKLIKYMELGKVGITKVFDKIIDDDKEIISLTFGERILDQDWEYILKTETLQIQYDDGFFTLDLYESYCFLDDEGVSFDKIIYQYKRCDD